MRPPDFIYNITHFFADARSEAARLLRSAVLNSDGQVVEWRTI
jgi:hypothetical protein